MRPFTDSRSERECVARGSIAYSAVTQPRPLPLRQRGTPSVTDAAHSTRVLPNSTSTEPSAWSSQLRVMRTGRSASSARPSGRGMSANLQKNGLSDVEDPVRTGDCDLTVVCGGRLFERTVLVTPGHQVGQHELARTRPRCVLPCLLAGEVNVRGVVVAFEVRRLAQEQVGVTRELHQLLADTTVGGVRERLTACGQPHRIGLDRVVDALSLDGERAEIDGAGTTCGMEVVDLVEQVLYRLAEGRGDMIGDVARAVDGQAGRVAAGVVATRVRVRDEVEEVVAVHVADHHGVEVEQTDRALQGAGRPVAGVEEQLVAVVFDQVRRTGRLRPRERPGAADDGELHALLPSSCGDRSARATSPTSGPRNRRPSRPNGSGSPVARNRCSGAGSVSSRNVPSRASSVQTS